MFEAELKYRVRRDRRSAVEEAMLAAAVRAPLRERYLDVYFDDASGSLGASDRELRVRERGDETTGEVRAVLTFKAPPFEAASRSKPEWETGAGDAGALRALLAGLGFRESARLVKRCLNVDAVFEGKQYALTLAEVESLGDAFLEIERRCVSLEETGVALSGAAALASFFGLGPDDLCREYYTDMVRAKKAGS